MEMIKNAIFTACITAMISAVVMMIAPENRRRELRLICTLVLISCVAAGFAGGGIDISGLPLPDSRSLRFDYDSMLLSQSRDAVERQLTENLTKAGFSPRLVCIEVSFDQYNYIITDSADIFIYGLQDSDIPAIEAAAREIIGQESEVNIYDTSAETADDGQKQDEAAVPDRGGGGAADTSVGYAP